MKKTLTSISLCLSLTSFLVFSKVFVTTQSFNRPDFIEIQYKTFKKFLKDDYEFIVFNDGPNEDLRKRIENTCAQLNLRCIRIPQKIHTYAYLPRMRHEIFNHPCIKCANVVQYTLNEFGFKHDDIFAIIDSDLFLIKDFSIRAFMENNHIVGVRQDNNEQGIPYLWNGLVFFDMKTVPNKKMINFNCGKIDNKPVDVGGYMYYYFKETPEAKVKFLSVEYVRSFADKSFDELKKDGFSNPMIKFIQANPPVVELHCNKTFIHYRAGGNWDHKSQDYHNKKTHTLNTLIQELLN